MYRLQFICARLAAIAVFVLLLGCANVKEKDHAFPKGMEYFPEKRRVEVAFSEPIQSRKHGYQIVRLVQLTSDEMVVPMFITEQPRKGRLGRVTSGKAWEDVFVAVVEFYKFIHLPTGKRIKSYVLLVRSNEKDDEPWHVWQFNVGDIRGKSANGSIKLPKLSDLKLLTERKDGEEILEKVKNAQKVRQGMETWVEK